MSWTHYVHNYRYTETVLPLRCQPYACDAFSVAMEELCPGYVNWIFDTATPPSPTYPLDSGAITFEDSNIYVGSPTPPTAWGDYSFNIRDVSTFSTLSSGKFSDGCDIVTEYIPTSSPTGTPEIGRTQTDVGQNIYGVFALGPGETVVGFQVAGNNDYLIQFQANYVTDYVFNSNPFSAFRTSNPRIEIATNTGDLVFSLQGGINEIGAEIEVELGRITNTVGLDEEFFFVSAGVHVDESPAVVSSVTFPDRSLHEWTIEGWVIIRYYDTVVGDWVTSSFSDTLLTTNGFRWNNDGTSSQPTGTRVGYVSRAVGDISDSYSIPAWGTTESLVDPTPLSLALERSRSSYVVPSDC